VREGLREKYERLLALRLAHDRAKRDGAFEEPDPRREMTEIAKRWPGALRELDALPLDELRARITALSSDEPMAPWMRAQDAFHRYARGALAAKHWLGKRKRISAELTSEFRASASRDARLWADALADIASPPRGRLMDLVYARVARELDVSIAEARRLVR